MNNYGLDIWGDDNFIIEDGLLKLNHISKPSFKHIIKEITKDKLSNPIILRFPHIVKKQLDKLYTTFNDSIKLYDYDANFYAVFPLKVNQLPNNIIPMIKNSKSLNYGLEAGSKAELLLAMSYNNKNAPITVNGFKDIDMITIGFIAKSQGHNITITIEGVDELKTIVKVNKVLKLPYPNIGLRVKLHSSGSGTWAKSGGIDSKFGLNSTEILEAFEILKKYHLLDLLTMIHFHIGSDMNSIAPLKKALKESGHIYAQLIKMGAKNLKNINIGGGLAVEYSSVEKQIQYSLKEFASDVVFTLKDIAIKNNVDMPNIYTESGRFVVAPSAVLVVPTLELYSSEYNISSLKFKKQNPPLIQEMYSLYKDINKTNAKEYMHDSLEHLESIHTLFDLGYVDLVDRSNAEILTHLIIKKSLKLVDIKNDKELKQLNDKIQEKYLLNFSIFQSLPDYWGIGQKFPIVPLTHLDKKATRSANIWDITCDSDGEIPFDNRSPLYLHDVDLQKEEYFIGFFHTGAYQDILGMKHNLFGKPMQANVVFEDEILKVEDIIPSQSISKTLKELEFDKKNIIKKLLKATKKKKLQKKLKQYFKSNSYLNTI
jgi:arginine decarboxylase